MNLLLVEPHEIVDGRVVLGLDDRRARHLREVIDASDGSTIRAGIVHGGTGTARVALDAAGITLALAITEPASTPLPIELVLAVPRPKVLTRAIEAAASFAVVRIALTNAWRVDKSYLRSPRIAPDALAHAARLGAEQGATTHVPPITVHERLMPLLDARWPAPGPGTCLVAHPGGVPIEHAIDGAPVGADHPITLAIGPEGGWIEREVETLCARGFTAVSIGPQILRVETALAAALGQLVLLLRDR